MQATHEDIRQTDLQQEGILGFLVSSFVDDKGRTTNDDPLDWLYIQTAILVSRQGS